MLWLKAFHIVFVVVWFAGLFALPRLFVYHAAINDTAGRDRFKIMERRMFGMMTSGAALTLGLGIAMLVATPAYLEMRWLHIKLILVVLLLAFHVYCYRLLIEFREDRNSHSATWLRVFNELPLIPLLGAVLLVVLKPAW